jgi:hypothetical protein
MNGMCQRLKSASGASLFRMITEVWPQRSRNLAVPEEDEPRSAK